MSILHGEGCWCLYFMREGVGVYISRGRVIHERGLVSILDEERNWCPYFKVFQSL